MNSYEDRFLEYYEGSTSYRVWLLEERRVEFARNMMFLETIPEADIKFILKKPPSFWADAVNTTKLNKGLQPSYEELKRSTLHEVLTR